MVTVKRRAINRPPKRYSTAYNYGIGEWRQSYTPKHDRKMDEKRKAKAPGWRPVYKNGKLDHYYFERRENRSDSTKQRMAWSGTTKPKTHTKKTCKCRCIK